MTQTKTTTTCPDCHGKISGPRQSQQSLQHALAVHAQSCPKK